MYQDVRFLTGKVRHVQQTVYINQQKVMTPIIFHTNAISLELNKVPNGPFWRREISKSTQSIRGIPTIGQNHSACKTHWRKLITLRGCRLELERGGL